jgi:cbb3-type cytochrome oxidase subunit 3
LKPAPRLLWFDCAAGGVSGALLLLLRPWLEPLYGISGSVLLAMALVSLGYCAYGFSLTQRASRSRAAVLLLVGGNFAWAAVCLGLAVALWSSASWVGVAALAIEAAFVGILAAVEVRNLERLLG